jgi:hypothetical protein
MNRVIWLPATEAKCIASACRAGACARREVSADNRPLADFSTQHSFYGPTCTAPVWIKRILPSQAVKPADAPKIKDWIGQ